jgi:hypothetical protein
MSRPKTFFLVLDVETANSLEQPLPYDIGWAVCDRYGNILEQRSYIVAEIYHDLSDVMKTAYYAEKIPQYEEDIRTGKRTVATMFTIRRQMLADMKNYKIKQVGAYNMAFDKKALTNLVRYVSKSFCRWWFPFGTEFFCIWNMACDALLERKSYIDFAVKNGLLSEKNNILTSAECVYKYMKKYMDFIESHTGLEDVLIEVEIMAYCYRQHKKMQRTINPSCWMRVQKKRKEVEAVA